VSAYFKHWIALPEGIAILLGVYIHFILAVGGYFTYSSPILVFVCKNFVILGCCQTRKNGKLASMLSILSVQVLY